MNKLMTVGTPVLLALLTAISLRPATDGAKAGPRRAPASEANNEDSPEVQWLRGEATTGVSMSPGSVRAARARVAVSPSAPANPCANEIDEARKTLKDRWNLQPHTLNPARYEALLEKERSRQYKRMNSLIDLSDLVADTDRRLWELARKDPFGNAAIDLRRSIQDKISRLPRMPFDGFKFVASCVAPTRILHGSDCVNTPHAWTEAYFDADGEKVPLEDVLRLPNSKAEARIDARLSGIARKNAYAAFMGLDPKGKMPAGGFAHADDYFHEMVVGKLGLRAECFPEWQLHRDAAGALSRATTAVEWVTHGPKGPNGDISKETAGRVKHAVDESIHASYEAARRAAEREHTQAGDGSL